MCSLSKLLQVETFILIMWKFGKRKKNKCFNADVISCRLLTLIDINQALISDDQ